MIVHPLIYELQKILKQDFYVDATIEETIEIAKTYTDYFGVLAKINAIKKSRHIKHQDKSYANT